MQKPIIKIGSSLAVIIPQAVAREAGLQQGDLVDIAHANNSILIRHTATVRPVQVGGAVRSHGATLKTLRAARPAFTRRSKSRCNTI